MQGVKGRQFNDRDLAGKVRNQVLEIARKALADEEHPLYRVTYENLVRNILPRLNEVSGPQGEALKVQLVMYGESDPLKSYLDKKNVWVT